jgi:hypothetical protein
MINATRETLSDEQDALAATTSGRAAFAFRVSRFALSSC